MKQDHVIAEIKKYYRNIYNRINEEVFKGDLPEAYFNIVGALKTKVPSSLKILEDGNFVIKIPFSRIFITKENLLISLLHQMIHIDCNIKGILDTGNGGCFHNRKYLEVAKKIGLDASYQPRTGSEIIGLGRLAYLQQLEILESYYDFIQKIEYESIAKVLKANNSRLTKYTCPSCKQNVWGGQNVNVFCGKCGTHFIIN